MRTPAFAPLALLLVACGPSSEEVSLEGTALSATFSGDTVALTFADLQTEGGCPALAEGAVTFDGGTFETTSDCEAGTLSMTLTPTPTDPPSDGELVVESGGGTVRWAATNLLAARRFVRVDGFDQVPRGATIRLNFEPATDVLSEPSLVELRDGPDALPLTFRLDGEGVAIDVPVSAEGGQQTLAITAAFTVPTSTCEGFASCAAAGTRAEELDVAIAP